MTLQATRGGALVLTGTEAARHAARARRELGERGVGRSGASVILPRAYHLSGAVVQDRTTVAARPLTYTRTLRPEQRQAVAAMVRHGGGVVVAPCGGGKTEIGLALAARWRQRTLVLVGTKDLREQWIARARTSLGARVADHDRPCADVVVMTVQGLARMEPGRLRELGRGFGLVVMDEAHHGAASTWSRVMLELPARYRVALTATLEREDGQHPLVVAHFGAVHRISEQELRETGATMLPRVRFVLVDDADSDDFVARLVAKCAREGRRVLVLVRLVEHAHELASRISRAGVRCSPVVGPMPVAERTRALAGLRRGSLRALVATSLADEGLDLPELDTVILATSTASLPRVQQRIGRALRPGPGKASPLVFDLVLPASEEAALKRERLYRELGYPVVVLS